MKHLNKIVLVALAATMFSCDQDFDNPVEDIKVTAGEADFQKYIALGNSLTSGYRDNALYRSGQENSYPNMLAGLMKAAGGGEFTTPYMPDDTGGFTNLGIKGKYVLQLVNGALTPVPTDAVNPLTPIPGDYQNMGVPGAKSYNLMQPGYGIPDPAGYLNGTKNPYFTRIAKSIPTSSIVGDAISQSPTFFSLWIGNNDVLGYATSGGLGIDQKGNKDVKTYNQYDISDPDLVKEEIEKVIIAMTGSAKKPKGVIANIPSVTSIPYFTTVPYAPLSPTNPSFAPMIDNLNKLYGGLNQFFDAAGVPERKIVFSKTAASAVVIKDKDLVDLSAQITAFLVARAGFKPEVAKILGESLGQARQATSKDLLVLTSSSVIGQPVVSQVQKYMAVGLSMEEAGMYSVAGISYPMADNYVLTEKETSKVETAVVKYNTAISDLATKYNLALVDAYSEMKKLSSSSGIKYYGQTYTTTFVSGGAFSLDGVHLTGTGYAIVANMFADAINRKYQSTLRHVYPGNYPGIAIP
ncbi:G-D-S-L family lipolytic protein [Empedobacter brevis]|uniref:G-D-S-L family lipolytic protein n=1 Tax=Empedobacter brevis TaxID=247 RepID=UPI0023F0E6A0|nr:G-D-S-L family lipolytic protein [Empedobacter brevis]